MSDLGAPYLRSAHHPEKWIEQDSSFVLHFRSGKLSHGTQLHTEVFLEVHVLWAKEVRERQKVPIVPLLQPSVSCVKQRCALREQIVMVQKVPLCLLPTNRLATPT